MTSVAEARARMLGAAAALPLESVPLDAADGRVLAAAIVAERAQPPFAASAMDGYALRASDTPGDVRVVGESAAGRAFPRALGAGEAVRISTGAALPEGADTVLIQEEAVLSGDVLGAGALQAGRHVRAAGCDFSAGASLLARGHRLDPIAIALAAAAGCANLEVARRPRVAVMSCGDEVAPPGAPVRADQIYESCSFVVAALAQRWGASVTRIPSLPDDAAAIERAAASALEASDLVVFIGGASVGLHDHAKPTFQKLGAELLVSKVDMRPGKPTWFARCPGAYALGLPGNPASAIVAATLFLKPLLASLQSEPLSMAPQHARLAGALAANGPREAYLRARVSGDGAGGLIAEAFQDQDSSLLSVFAQSNALLIRPSHAPAAQAGEVAAFLPL